MGSRSTQAVIEALRAGYGVEDIEVMGLADRAYTRRLIAQLRQSGLIDWVYRRADSDTTEI